MLCISRTRIAKVGMGEDLFEQFPDYVEKANHILGYDITDSA